LRYSTGDPACGLLGVFSEQALSASAPIWCGCGVSRSSTRASRDREARHEWAGSILGREHFEAGAAAGHKRGSDRALNAVRWFSDLARLETRSAMNTQPGESFRSQTITPGRQSIHPMRAAKPEKCETDRRRRLRVTSKDRHQPAAALGPSIVSGKNIGLHIEHPSTAARPAGHAPMSGLHVGEVFLRQYRQRGPARFQPWWGRR